MPRRLSGLGRHLLAFPSVGWTALFFLAPLLLLALYSLGTTNLLTYDVQFGWTTQHYRDVFQGLYLDAIRRSLLLSVASTLACLVIGFPVAYTISRAKGRWQLLLLLMVMVPFWTSFVVRTYGVFNLIGDQGPLAQLLQSLGLVKRSTGIHLLFTQPGVAIGIVYSYLPLMVLPLYVALERIDPALLSAAADLGASPRRTFRRVVLPLAAPGIVAGCVLVAVPATGEYVVPAILGGDKTLMYGNVVAQQFQGIGNYPLGSALAVSLTALLTVVLLISRRRTARAEAVVA
jgi:ABC-type spermidine/putrescine transport system permease subunit I